MSVPGRLQRRLSARLIGGNTFQWILTAALVVITPVVVWLVIVGIPVGDLLRASAGYLFYAGIWGLGVTAHAEVDDESVRWRYYLRRTCPWDQIEVVRFTRARRWAYRGYNVPAIAVRVAGRDHFITPAYDCSDAALARFGQVLSGYAIERGIQTTVEAARDGTWQAVRTD